MDYLAVVIVVAILIWYGNRYRNRNRNWNLPPGPYPFPIIGNLFQLGRNPHHSFATLSKTYGPLMSLKLGRICAVVISSPEVAKRVLRDHDESLCNRSVISAAEAHNYHMLSMAFLPVGSRWRKNRKICREHLFSARRLDESQGLRQEKLAKLREYVRACSVAGRVVNVGEAVFTVTLNLITYTLFSVDFATYDSDDEDRVARDLKKIVEGLVNNSGAPNVADFFPIFKPFDLQGIKRRSEFFMGKLLHKFEDIISSRLSQGSDSVIGSANKYDLLQTLLDLMEDKGYSLSINDIKILFLDLFLGGTHTITSTVEWAMTELLINPAKMANAKNELTTVIGKKGQVQESDISRLPYLQAVIKETLRLHPAVPLLIPRKADCDVEINGYTIPKNAQIFINVWAIGRDPNIWANPTSFEPERFLNTETDYKGRYFTLIPFGSGRRICPGMALADRILPLTLASLIHNFDWKLEAGVKLEDLDTTDKFGIALHKAVPLMAIPIND